MGHVLVGASGKGRGARYPGSGEIQFREKCGRRAGPRLGGVRDMSEKDRESGQEVSAPLAVDQPRRGVSRRRVLQTGAAAGVALAWAVPAVEALTSGSAFAAGVSPTTPPPSDFVLAVAFSALDPDQNNTEGYFWPLGVVVTSNSNGGYNVNYLTNISSSPSPYTVYDTINGQLFAYHVDIPPANGDLSAYENGSTPYSLSNATYSNTPGYTQPPNNPAAALGQIRSGAYDGLGVLTLAPPPGYPSLQKSAGFDATFDGSALSINFYVDEVQEVEKTGTANFPDIFIYQATVFQPNSTLTGVETATVTSEIWQGPENPTSPPAADAILLYSSSSGYPNVTYTPGTATGSSGKVNSLSYVFSEF